MKRKLASGCLLLALASMAPLAHAKMLDRVVAAVDGRPICLSDVKRHAAPLLQDIQKLPADKQAGATAQLMKETLEIMIEERLIDIDASRAQVTVRPEDVDKAIDLVASQNNVPREALMAAAAQRGMPPQEYRALLAEQIREAKWFSAKVQPTLRPGEPPEAGRKRRLEELRKTVLVEVMP